MRQNLDLGSTCGIARPKEFANTIYHEARHAYQYQQVLIIGNDTDGDYLVNKISIAPTTIFLDTKTPRDVCSLVLAPDGRTVVGTKQESRCYHGDKIKDSYYDPDFAESATEQDAFIFAMCMLTPGASCSPPSLLPPGASCKP